MRSWRWYSKLLLALLVVAFAYFVWPTPWRYEHRGTENSLVRINRLTDEVQILILDGWYSPNEAP